MSSAPAQNGWIENVEDHGSQRGYFEPSRLGPRAAHLPQSARLCAYCKQKADDKTQLKRCAGCSVAMYCSKECQKGAWPAHKSLCRTSDVQSFVEDATGFPTPQSLLEAMETWHLLHNEALAMIATMTVRVCTEDLPEKTVADARCAIFFSIASTQQAGVEGSGSQGPGNPATAFRIQFTKLVDNDCHKWISKRWPSMQEMCANRHAALRGPSHPNLLGCVPAVFAVKGTYVMFNTVYPVSRASRAVTAMLGGELTVRALFKDTLALYSTAVNQGVVFCSSKDATRPHAHGAPGKCQFVRNRWRWVLDAGWDWNFVVDASGGKLGKMPTTNTYALDLLAITGCLFEV